MVRPTLWCLLVLLSACSNKSVVTVHKAGSDTDALNAAINVPRAVAAYKAAPQCEYVYPDKRKACEAQQRQQANALSESIKKHQGK